MGLFDWFKEWRHERRRKRELAAVDHLRRELEAEMKRFQKLDAVVSDIETELNKGNFDEARKLVPDLVRMMKEKRILDKAEMLDFKKLKRTMLSDLRDQLKGVR